MIAWLLGCGGPDDALDRVPKDGVDRTGETGVEPEDTGLEPCSPGPPPIQASVERVPEVRLHAAWSLQAGRGAVRFANIDGDRCEELLVGETRNEAAPFEADAPTERVFAVDAAARTGRLVDAGLMIAESGYTEEDGATEDGELEPYSKFGWDAAVDRTGGALLIGSQLRTDYFDVASFPLDSTTTAHAVDATGILGATPGLDWGLLHGRFGLVELVAGRRLWTSTWETIGPEAFAGQVYLFDLPLVGVSDQRDARAVYRADPGDYVQYGVAWDDDLDGDGVADLAMGTQWRSASTGAIAILSDPPDGDHRIWDLAVATFDGTVPEGRLGEQVAGGDLDGDGYAELLTGAAMVEGASTFHAFRGPFAGDRLASDSEWTISGEDGLERLGVSSITADLDGDGDQDLVVGRPGNPALGTLDGSVLLFAGPVAPGSWTAADADVVVRNGSAPGTGDFFGYFLRTGDMNDDGAYELAIAAPTDVEDGRPVGSVQLLFGRPELFGP